MEKVIGHRSMGKLAAAAIGAVGLAGFAASQADASLIVDVRATGGTGGTGVSSGGKQVVFGAQGDTVVLTVFARITGTNGANDESLSSAHGSVATGPSIPGGSGLLGNLSGGRLSPFTGASSQQGSVQDIDADGDLDIGSTGSTVTGKFVARADAPVVLPAISAQAGEIAIGQFTFTYTGGGTDTFANFITRKNQTGGNLFSAATWFEDGISSAPTTSLYDVGTAVHLAVPEPTSAALMGLGALGLLARRKK